MASHLTLINHSKKEFCTYLKFSYDHGFEDNQDLLIYIKECLGDDLTFISEMDYYDLIEVYPGYNLREITD